MDLGLRDKVILITGGGFGIGAAVGLLVTSREGRPVKIEGNPAHPDSLGATDAATGLYDLARACGVPASALSFRPFISCPT